MFERSAFCLMNAFHARAPHRRLAEGVHARSCNRPPVGVHPEIPAADEIQARMVKVIVGPVVDGDALGRQTVPVVQVPREKSAVTLAPWLWLK